MKNILVISPHPDDESIGCGGTIRKHIIDGDRVEVVFLTSGEKGGHGRTEEETISIREGEAKRAAEILQISKIEFWRQNDGGLKSNDEVINRLSGKIKDIKADIIYVPHELDDHPDHLAAHMITIIAAKNSAQKILVRTYEVWTPMGKMDYIIDITPYIYIKRQAIAAHKSQCEVLDFEEATLGLNRYRGEMHCWPEGDYAEVFQEIKF